MAKEAVEINGIRQEVKAQRVLGITNRQDKAWQLSNYFKGVLRWSPYLLIPLGISLGVLFGDSGIVNADSLAYKQGIAQQVSASACSFQLGFREIANKIPSVVGSCLDNESYDPQNGNSLQHATGGLLVWRKLDNLVAFTDGNRTWIEGPYGLVTRLNSQRFSWEKETPPGIQIIGESQIRTDSIKPHWSQDELNTPLYRVAIGTNRVALTFDDGYGYRKEILDILNQNNTRATFCFTGEVYQSDPSFVDQASKSGDEFCNHTYTHPNLLSLFQLGQVSKINSEIDSTEEVLNRLNQTSKPYSRPPYWSSNSEIRQLIANKGYRTIMASLDPEDWRLNIDPNWLSAYVVSNTKPGNIIVLHTLHRPTLLALQDILTGLKNRGLIPGNLSQLISE